MPWVEPVADFQSCTRPNPFGTQSRARKVRCNTEKYDVSVRARCENAAQLNTRTIDARNCEVSRRAYAGRELDRIGRVGDFRTQRPEAEDGQARQSAFADVCDHDFTSACFSRGDRSKRPTVSRADNQHPHAGARSRFDARRRPGDVKGRKRNRLRNISRHFGPRRALEQKGRASGLDRIRLPVDRPKLREVERRQRQTGKRHDTRTNCRRIGIVGSHSSDLAGQYAARVCHPVVQLASLLDESEQRSPHRPEVASVFGSQLPKTAGVDVQILYRNLDFHWSTWGSWIETISGLRQRVLADNSVYAVLAVGGIHTITIGTRLALRGGLQCGRRRRHERRPLPRHTLEDIHGLLKPRLTIVYRNRVRPARLVSRPERDTRIGSVFPQNVVHHVVKSQTPATTVVAAHDALQNINSRLQGRHALAHVLDDRMRADDLGVLLAAPGRTCRAHRLVRVASSADDW